MVVSGLGCLPEPFKLVQRRVAHHLVVTEKGFLDGAETALEFLVAAPKCRFRVQLEVTGPD